MHNITIRRAFLSDLPYLYEVCLKTANEGKDATKLFSDPYLVGQYYVAPYVVYPKAICFVTEYENIPQGYVVAVPETITYKEWLEEHWLAPLRKQFPQNEPFFSEKQTKIINILHDRGYQEFYNGLEWYTNYPAHLHINLLPVIQGQGAGSKLIESLFKELKEQNIAGLHLNIRFTNPSALQFYKKMGFIVIKEHDWGYTLGKLT